MEKEGKRILAKGNNMNQGGNTQYIYRVQHNSRVQKSDGLQTSPNPVSPMAPRISWQIASHVLALPPDSKQWLPCSSRLLTE